MAANRTPAVCVVVYGNRAYDDALLELKETVVGVGCIPIALGAYIGEHSYSNAEAPVAKGRPDADDLKHAQSFGRRVRDKILSLPSIDQAQDIQVPGRHPLPPYSGRVRVSPAEVIAISDACLHCGTCAQACPASAIHPDTGVPISTALCTMCCACVRKCPVGARTLKVQKARDFAVRLSQWPQKQPEVFI
jgi:ferredoxin